MSVLISNNFWYIVDRSVVCNSSCTAANHSVEMRLTPEVAHKLSRKHTKELAGETER